jgi:hypothetical protein
MNNLELANGLNLLDGNGSNGGGSIATGDLKKLLTMMGG